MSEKYVPDYSNYVELHLHNALKKKYASAQAEIDKLKEIVREVSHGPHISSRLQA